MFIITLIFALIVIAIMCKVMRDDMRKATDAGRNVLSIRQTIFGEKS